MDRAAIFDFNGTLFWDSEINYISWNNCIERWFNRPYTRELYAQLNGRTNEETLEVLYGKKLDSRFVSKKSNEKTAEYLRVLESQSQSISLARGAESLFKALIDDGIKIAIATSAPTDLMVHYERYFNLSRFFKDEFIISSDGSIPSKPDPTIYLKTIERLNVDPSSCIVFEDTKSGILSAHKAKVNKVIAINSDGSDIKTTSTMKETSMSIDSFEDLKFKTLFDGMEDQ
ncbi:MAG: HAD family phosphatase [Sphaerochaetaceae bacterium]|nr:HAD family phosphatase [Sphaerochaetaceae bacterium]